MKKVFIAFLFSAAAALAQSTHNAVLSWTPNPGNTGTVTFNVYRTTGACPTTGFVQPATPLAGGITLATYTDSTVASGQTYCYAVTAVQGTLESVDSADAQATVTPFPPSGLTVVVK